MKICPGCTRRARVAPEDRENKELKEAQRHNGGGWTWGGRSDGRP